MKIAGITLFGGYVSSRTFDVTVPSSTRHVFQELFFTLTDSFIYHDNPCRTFPNHPYIRINQIISKMHYLSLKFHVNTNNPTCTRDIFNMDTQDVTYGHFSSCKCVKVGERLISACFV